MLKQFIAKETAYFKKLHRDAQKLLITIFLYNLIGPLFGIFINAFLWRQTHNIMLIATYNAFLFLVIPVGFYLNGHILRRYHPAVPYLVSLILASLSLATLMFLPVVSYPIAIAFGIIYGLCAGTYWANRNLLTLKTTTTHDRIYFSSIEIASSTTTNVIIPAFIGWFIVFGSFIHLYSPIQGYQLLVLFMLFIIVRIGITSNKIRTDKITIPTLIVTNVSTKWKNFRWIEFILGLKEAVVTFVPVLLVLILVGKEGALGTIQSISAILASILIYTLGKKLNTNHRTKLVAMSVIIAVIGAALFGMLYSAIGVFIFFAAQAVAQPFIWVAGNSINYDLIDQDNKDPRQHYAYVCDQEIYLNSGRVVGILLFILFILLTSSGFALRYGPLLFTSTQIFLLIAVIIIEKKQIKHLL